MEKCQKSVVVWFFDTLEFLMFWSFKIRLKEFLTYFFGIFRLFRDLPIDKLNSLMVPQILKLMALNHPFLFGFKNLFKNLTVALLALIQFR